MAFCKNCGNQVNDGTKFCPKCGQAVDGAPQQQVFQQQAHAYQQTQQQPVKPDTHMLLAILTTIFCCLPTGIYAIILASKVDKLYYSGQYDEAEEASNGAKKWSIIGLVIGIIIGIIYAIYYAVIVAAMLAE